jgi:hypothetical protein
MRICEYSNAKLLEKKWNQPSADGLVYPRTKWQAWEGS